MSLDNLKHILHNETKYNFIFTGLNFNFSSNHLFNNQKEISEIYSCYLFFSPFHHYQLLFSINEAKNNFDLELANNKRSQLPKPGTWEYSNNINPTDFDIKNEHSYIINNWNNVNFFQEPTLNEALISINNNLINILKKHNISSNNQFMDDILILLDEVLNFNSNEYKNLILEDKNRGILFKKLNNNLIEPKNKSHLIKI